MAQQNSGATGKPASSEVIEVGSNLLVQSEVLFNNENVIVDGLERVGPVSSKRAMTYL